MNAILLVSAFVAAVIALYFSRLRDYFRERNRRIKLIEKFAGWPAYPIIGNALQFSTKTHGSRLAIEDGANLMRYWIGNRVYVIPLNGETMKPLLESNVELVKGFDYEFFRQFIGNGLITSFSTGDYWRARRKMLTPAFHFAILADFVEVFNSESELISASKTETDVDIFPYLKRFTLDVICMTAMGTKTSAQRDHDSNYVRAIENFSQYAIEYYIRYPFYQFRSLWYLFGKGRATDRALETIKDFTKSVRLELIFLELMAFYFLSIKQHRLLIGVQSNIRIHYQILVVLIHKIRDYKRFHRGALSRTIHIVQVIRSRITEREVKSVVKAEGDESVEIKTKRKPAFLDLLLNKQDENKLSFEELDDEVTTFIFAGHDTTAAAIGWCLWCLARSPKIQDAVFCEVSEVIGKRRHTLSIEDLSKMPLLERCLKEALRLFPSAPNLQRTLQNDLEMGGFVVPKGSNVCITPLPIHHNKNVWKNPFEFNPDNFLPEAIEKRTPHDYIPFSAGPRNCIGQKFAILEEKVALAHLLQAFRFEADGDLWSNEPCFEAIQRPHLGFPLRLTCRCKV